MFSATPTPQCFDSDEVVNPQMLYLCWGFEFLLWLPPVDDTPYSNGIYGHLFDAGSVLSVQLLEAVELCLFIRTLFLPLHSSCHNGGLI